MLIGERSAVDRHRCHMVAKSSAFVDEDHSNQYNTSPKGPYKSGFIVNSSSCTIELSMILTSCLTAIENMFYKIL